MQSDFRLLIGGSLIATDETMAVVNPATGVPFAECPRGRPQDIDAAVAAAKSAFPSWSEMPIGQRQAYLEKLATELEANLEPMAVLLTQEQGKPLAEARWELASCVVYLRYFATQTLPVKVIEDAENKHVLQKRRPLGVVAGIIPWNFPMLLLHFKLPAALIAGNTIVIKPSPTTPLTTLRYGELCARVLPPGVVNFVTDQNDLGSLLTRHPDVRKISFTGSTATGRRVMSSAAESLKRVTLELGGNDAAIVLDDVDPKRTAADIFRAAFMNCGQVCLAIKRVYVHDAVYEPLCEELSRLAQEAVVGDGLQDGTTIGPIQNRMQFDKVLDLINDARQTGRRVVGGEPLGRPGFFVRPAIICDALDGDRIVDEEQFGPVLPVIRYSDPDQAIACANASPMGLGGSIWCADRDRARKFAEQIDAGMVWINQHLDIGPHIPFGGAKQSGLGVESAEEGIAEFTQLQVINAAL